jgi:hypothetical protein
MPVRSRHDNHADGPVTGRQIGGSRAMRVASDYHAARLVFQSVGEPGADYGSVPLLIPFGSCFQIAWFGALRATIARPGGLRR